MSGQIEVKSKGKVLKQLNAEGYYNDLDDLEKKTNSRTIVFKER